MKIQAIDYLTNEPLINTQIKIQVKEKNNGYLSYKTDAYGYFELDEKYKDQQISYYSQGSTFSKWIKASDNAVLYALTLENQPC